MIIYQKKGVTRLNLTTPYTNYRPENRDWKLFEETTNIKSYFAHPYHSWERGSNENANGLLRDYFPKGADFSIISESEITKVEHSLNSRPRKRLGGKTPLEVWGVALTG